MTYLPLQARPERRRRRGATAAALAIREDLPRAPPPPTEPCPRWLFRASASETPAVDGWTALIVAHGRAYCFRPIPPQEGDDPAGGGAVIAAFPFEEATGRILGPQDAPAFATTAGQPSFWACFDVEDGSGGEARVPIAIVVTRDRETGVHLVTLFEGDVPVVSGGCSMSVRGPRFADEGRSVAFVTPFDRGVESYVRGASGWSREHLPLVPAEEGVAFVDADACPGGFDVCCCCSVRGAAADSRSVFVVRRLRGEAPRELLRRPLRPNAEAIGLFRGHLYLREPARGERGSDRVRRIRLEGAGPDRRSVPFARSLASRIVVREDGTLLVSGTDRSIPFE